MVQEYIDYIASLIVYTKDDDGRFFASVPGHPEYITEGDTMQEAMTNMKEVVEDIVLYKLQTGDKQILQELRTISYTKVYA